MPTREAGPRIRPADQDDLDILWDFLAIAAYEPNIDAAKSLPFVAAHLAGWQRPVTSVSSPKAEARHSGRRGRDNSPPAKNRSFLSMTERPKSQSE